MSSFVAICAVSALFLVALAPLALLAIRRRPALPIALLTITFVTAAAGYQTGLFARGDFSDLRAAELAGPVVPTARCVEIITLLERAGVILDRGSPPRLLVSQAAWAQVPEEAQTVVVDCVQRTWPGSPAVRLEQRAN